MGLCFQREPEIYQCMIQAMEYIYIYAKGPNVSAYTAVKL